MDLPTIVFPSSSTLHALPVARDGRVRPPYFDSLDVQWPRADCDQPERHGVGNRQLALVEETTRPYMPTPGDAESESELSGIGERAKGMMLSIYCKA
jgi:hypothetical protein